jgi:hypothetical protein
VIDVDKEYSRIYKEYMRMQELKWEEKQYTPMNATQEGESLAGMHLELLLGELVKSLENEGYPKEHIDGVKHARIKILQFVANRHLGMGLFEEEEVAEVEDL